MIPATSILFPRLQHVVLSPLVVPAWKKVILVRRGGTMPTTTTPNNNTIGSRNSRKLHCAGSSTTGTEMERRSLLSSSLSSSSSSSSWKCRWDKENSHEKRSSSGSSSVGFVPTTALRHSRARARNGSTIVFCRPETTGQKSHSDHRWYTTSGATLLPQTNVDTNTDTTTTTTTNTNTNTNVKKLKQAQEKWQEQWIAANNDERAQKVKKSATNMGGMMKQYGPVFIGTYLSVYIATLSGIFGGIETALLDPIAWGALGTEAKMNGSTTASVVADMLHDYTWTSPYAPFVQDHPRWANFALAWLTTKTTEPLRLALVVPITPRIARYFGYVPQPPPPQQQQQHDEKKDNIS